MSYQLGDERFGIELTDIEKIRYAKFIERHKKCSCPGFTGGKITFMITPNSLGIQIIVKCNMCGETKDCTDYNTW